MKREQPELLVVDEQVEQASRRDEGYVASVAAENPSACWATRKSACRILSSASALRRAISPNIWRSCATRACCVPWDANRVFYRVGDVRTLEVVSLIREVFCGLTDCGRYAGKTSQ